MGPNGTIQTKTTACFFFNRLVIYLSIYNKRIAFVMFDDALSVFALFVVWFAIVPRSMDDMFACMHIYPFVVCWGVSLRDGVYMGGRII